MLGTRTFQRPDGPGAPTSMDPHTAFHGWAMSGAWRRQKTLMARLRSAARSARSWQMSSSRAAACLSSSSCSWPCVVGRNPGDTPRRSSVSRSAASDRMPCRAASAWYAAGARAARVSERRTAAGSRFPHSGGSPSAGSVPAGDGCRRPTTRARASCVAWRCSNTLSTAAAGMDP